MKSEKAIKPVGFDQNEGLLPYSARSFIGYRLLTEFFVFPEKFLFFDLVFPLWSAQKTFGKSVNVFLYLNEINPLLERQVSTETFALGCTPVVNLFRQRATPIELSQRNWEYPVRPDARQADAFEVYSIDKVYASSPEGEITYLYPFYFSDAHGKGSNRPHWFWHATRHRDGSVDDRSSFSLTFVNEAFDPASPANWTLSVETTCINRHKPKDLLPSFEMVEQPPTIKHLSCLKSPTERIQMPDRHHTHWKLISHLMLNHLSLSGNAIGRGQTANPSPLQEISDRSADALHSILGLYNFADSDQVRSLIHTISDVRYRLGVARTPNSPLGTFCRGLDVEIDFDVERFSQKGIYLFSCVLERFFGLYCSINSFTRLTTKLNQGKVIWKRWPARSGNQFLL